MLKEQSSQIKNLERKIKVKKMEQQSSGKASRRSTVGKKVSKMNQIAEDTDQLLTEKDSLKQFNLLENLNIVKPIELCQQNSIRSFTSLMNKSMSQSQLKHTGSRNHQPCMMDSKSGLIKITARQSSNRDEKKTEIGEAFQSQSLGSSSTSITRIPKHVSYAD